MSEIVARRSERGFNSGNVYKLVAPISYNDTAVKRDIANLKAALKGKDVAGAFISAVTPTNMTRRDLNMEEFYPTMEAYQYAMADVIHEEYKAITDAGFILQLDRPAQDPAYQLESEEEIAKALDAAIEIENYALRGIPEELTRLHWCGGSSNRPHINNQPMGQVAPQMLKLNVGAYGFEAASPPPRARVADLGGHQAARGQGHRPGSDHPVHERGRAPGAGLLADQELRPVRRT